MIAGWWDNFELWVAGLPFIPQFLVVLFGMVPVSFAIAFVLDRSLRALLRMIGRDRTQVLELPVAPVEPAAPALEARTVVQSGAR